MTTIAKLVTEIGGDPTGLSKALDTSSRKIGEFLRNSKGQFMRAMKPTDEFINMKPQIAALENYSDALNRARINAAKKIPPPQIDTSAAQQTIKALEAQFRLGASDIRESLFRGITDQSGAKQQMTALAKEFNQGILNAIQTAASGGTLQSAAQIALTNALKPAGLAAGQATGRQIVAGLASTTTSNNISRALVPGYQQIVAQANTQGQRAGRSFAQSLTATIHRHRALIPTLAGLLIGQALSGASDVAKATAGLGAIDRQAVKTVESLKAGEKILHEFAMLASFILPPIPGLIAAVVGGVIGAIVGMVAHGKEQLVKAREEFRKTLDGMIDDIDQLGLQKKLEKVMLGSRSSGLSQLVRNAFRGGLLDLEARQNRDLAALAELNNRNRLRGGLLTLDPAFRNSVEALTRLIDDRKPLIAEAQRQAEELRDAILNPADARAGFGGQLPAVKSTAISKGIKDLEKDLGSLIGLFRAETQVGREAFDVLDRIMDAYGGINKEIKELQKTDPFSEKLLTLRQMRNEVEQLLEPLRQLQSQRFPGGVQQTPTKPPSTFFDLDRAARSIIIQGGGRIVTDFGIEVRLLTNEMTPLKVEFAELKDAARDTANAFLDSTIAIGKRLGEALNPLRLFGSVVDSIANAMTPSLEALDAPLRQLASTVGSALKPVFDALAPVIKDLTPIIGAIVQVLAPIIEALVPIIAAFIPILRALFPIIKLGAIIATYLFQAFATGASIFLRAMGNIVIGWGEILKALATGIDKLPFVSARGAINAAQGIIEFGRSLLGASDEFKKSADQMAEAREVIRDLSIDDTQNAIDDLGEAAARTAGILNGPQGFRVELLRFTSQTARANSTSDPHDRTGGSGRPDDPSRLGALIVEGDLNIDARQLTSTQLFDVVRGEARRRSMAAYGTTQRAGETLA